MITVFSQQKDNTQHLNIYFHGELRKQLDSDKCFCKVNTDENPLEFNKDGKYSVNVIHNNEIIKCNLYYWFFKRKDKTISHKGLVVLKSDKDANANATKKLRNKASVL